jgi:hypothetical protein
VCTICYPVPCRYRSKNKGFWHQSVTCSLLNLPGNSACYVSDLKLLTSRFNLQLRPLRKYAFLFIVHLTTKISTPSTRTIYFNISKPPNLFEIVFMRFVRFSEYTEISSNSINPLNAQLNIICHLLGLLGAHHILHVSRIRVNGVTFVIQTARFIMRQGPK